MTKTSDVVVIGAGVFGLAAAYGLLKAGFSVTLIERNQPGAGASGGVLGALSPHMPEAWNPKKAFQLEALVESEAFWREVEDRSGLVTGYGRVGRIMPIETEAALGLAKARIDGAQELWPEGFEWRIEQPPEDWMNADAAPFGVVHETLSARIFPRLACAALAKAVEALGGMIQKGSVLNLAPQRLCLESGDSIAFDTVVVAAGAASFDLVGLPKGMGSAVKGQAALLSAPASRGPLIYSDGLYVLPHANGQIAVGSTSEKVFDDPSTTDVQLDALIERARAVCPALRDAEVEERWAGLRPRSVLPDPILGRVPDFESAIIATAGFKIGFGLAPGVARAVAKIAQGKEFELPPSFTPEVHLARFAR